MKPPCALAHALACAGLAAGPTASADEGGVSFWMPGQYGSFVAAPGEPGWSLGLVYYHATTDAGAARQFPRGGRIVAGLDARVDLALLAPTFVPETPVAGGQVAFSIARYVGRVDVETTATIEGSVPMMQIVSPTSAPITGRPTSAAATRISIRPRGVSSPPLSA